MYRRRRRTRPTSCKRWRFKSRCSSTRWRCSFTTARQCLRSRSTRGVTCVRGAAPRRGGATCLMQPTIPALTTTSLATRWRMRFRAPGSSGARVTRRTPLAADQSGKEPGLGRRRCAGLCAPFLAGLRNGPSRCRPSGWAPRKARGACCSACCAASMVAGGEVMIVGRKDVTP